MKLGKSYYFEKKKWFDIPRYMVGIPSYDNGFNAASNFQNLVSKNKKRIIPRRPI